MVNDAERRAILDAWFRAYSARVLAYLMHRTDPQTAQDVLQEVFVTAYGKADRIADPPVGWLFGAARRLLANRQRSTSARAQGWGRAGPAGAPQAAAGTRQSPTWGRAG